MENDDSVRDDDGHMRYAKRLFGATVINAGAFTSLMAAKDYLKSEIVERFWDAKIWGPVAGEHLAYLLLTVPFVIYVTKQIMGFIDYRRAQKDEEAQPHPPDEDEVMAAEPEMPDTFEKTELPPYLNGANAELRKPVYEIRTR